MNIENVVRNIVREELAAIEAKKMESTREMLAQAKESIDRLNQSPAAGDKKEDCCCGAADFDPNVCPHLSRLYTVRIRLPYESNVSIFSVCAASKRPAEVD